MTVSSEEVDEPWIWGVAEDLTATEQVPVFTPQPPPKKNSVTESSTLSEFDQILADYYADETNPCRKPLPEMPDFSKPGRRISEQKCYEYIWDIKHREDQKERDKKCTHLLEIGGRDALPGEFPHMAAVGWKAAQGTWIFKCGSALISSKFVLSAAHCSMVSDRDTSVADLVPKIVRLGDKNIIDIEANGLPPNDVNIIKIIKHPKYKSPKQYYDIALFELENNVKFTSNVQPACLWRTFDTSPLGTKAISTGWGVIETAHCTTSPNLQAAEIDILEPKTCDELLIPKKSRFWSGMYDHQLCAGILAGGVDACQGDSGGPLQVRINLPPSSQGAIHYLIGVTSFGYGCALPNTPGVYTRVSSFIDWIESIVWK
ncbi:serine protease snake-like [Hyposmocoma kahamanoa]|uniref:serine protease snake-like n=1 Tax=Hyposmocoma kahamanoa TaxID=1477025 RepID=UPI000E6D7FA8|nr:serine protease snake-like [Hyposmocoma kahamanoa]